MLSSRDLTQAHASLHIETWTLSMAAKDFWENKNGGQRTSTVLKLVILSRLLMMIEEEPMKSFIEKDLDMYSLRYIGVFCLTEKRENMYIYWLGSRKGTTIV